MRKCCPIIVLHASRLRVEGGSSTAPALKFTMMYTVLATPKSSS